MFITNWMGEKLANCYITAEYTSNMGDKRMRIHTYKAINGLFYYGENYGGVGSYCRIKQAKN